MPDYAIIPKPAFIQYQQGHFQCDGFPVIAQSEFFMNEARVFNSQIEKNFGRENLKQNNRCIHLLKIENSKNGEEFYRLEILENEIRLSSSAAVGIYRALQTLRQIFLSCFNEGKLSIPCGIIEDYPRFPWRGFMLDCSRHFYSAGFIKNLLDALSLHHINIFHWHLTDDQGWRLPVKKYPLLTEVGSMRREHRLSGELYGGYYSEAEIRDIVSFAAQRHIEVVPEVDLPGHASAILTAYPNLGCTGGPYHVEDRFGIFEETLCAGNDDIFTLAQSVFDTLAELFPSRFVHIGGDEVLFNRWAECPKCKKRLSELQLTEPARLQSWITSRLVKMLAERGKTAIGWDEILENTDKFPLASDTIVMSWRGEEGGNAATSSGHRVIMTPQNHGCYLDYRALDDTEETGRLGVNTIAMCYNMNPVTKKMDENASKLVLGGQGNLWSEVIYSGKIAEYMIFPRICALAESFWSPENQKNIEDFAERLLIHRKRLDIIGLSQYKGKVE